MIRNDSLISFINMIQPGNNNYIPQLCSHPIPWKMHPNPKHQATKGRLRKEDWNAKAQTIEGWLQLCGREMWGEKFDAFCGCFGGFFGIHLLNFGNEILQVFVESIVFTVMPPKTRADPPPDLQQISCKGGGGDTKPQVSSNEIDGLARNSHEYHECRNLWTYHVTIRSMNFHHPPVRW